MRLSFSEIIILFAKMKIWDQRETWLTLNRKDNEGDKATLHHSINVYEKFCV